MRRTIIIIGSVLASAVAYAQSEVAFSPAEMIEGEVAGVRVTSPWATDNPLSAASVDIRGLNTIHGDNQPLYVIDGVIIGGDFDRTISPFWNYPGFLPAESTNPIFQLNAADIESIEVLKDASATAIYGSRGANGVIIINTVRKVADKREISLGVSGGAITSGSTFGGFIQNHNVKFCANNNGSILNISGSFAQMQDNGIRKGQDGGNIRMNFCTSPGRTVQFGANATASMGGFNNGSTEMEDTEDYGKRYSGLASAFATVNITKWLRWTTTGGFDFRTVNRYFWYGNGNEKGLLYNGLASIVSHAGINGNVKTELAVNRYFSEIHHLQASAAFEWQVQHSDYNTMASNDFYTHELKAKSINLANSALNVHRYFADWNHIAAYGTLSYDCGNYAGIRASFRGDNTRRYDDSRFTLYPAADAWISLSDILFPESKVVSSLRLEGGWGITGNEQSMPYAYIGDSITGDYPQVDVDGEPYYEGLFRLRTTEWHAGATLGFFGGRLELEAEYYRRANEDGFDVYSFGDIKAGRWGYSARSLQQERTTKINNRGLEVGINVIPVRTKNVEWTLSANASYNENQITALYYGDTKGHDAAPGLYYTANILGHSAGSLFGYMIGDDNYYVDVTRDGKITDADRVWLGNAVPKFQGGAGTSLRCKDFTLDVLGSWAADYNAVNLEKMIEEGQTLLTGRYIYRADHFRLAKVSLSYDIPLKSKTISGLRVSLSGHNLFCPTVVPCQRLVVISANLKF